jgi:integrating conjugative element membrane protein (TIGR03747 family)
MDFLLRLAATSTPLSGFDETLRRLAIGMWSFMESVYWSVQLIGLRLGMLITNLPFVLLMALAGTVDGLASRYVRTTSAGRESGFIYHRAKLTLWLLSLGLVAVYLMPPVTMDPRYVFPAFTVLVFIAVRVAAAWFKKYV